MEPSTSSLLSFLLFLWMALVSNGHVLTGASCDPETCQRMPWKNFVGFDYSGKELITVDYGRCEDTSGHGDHHVAVDLDALWNGEEGSSSGDADADHSSSCECGPSSYNHTDIFGRLGPTHMLSVATCDVFKQEEACRRVPVIHRFHAGSSYEVEMDLGYCTGTCTAGEELSCLRTSEVSVAILGPNGYTTESNITECGCADNKCFLQDYYQQVQTLERYEVGNATSYKTVEKVINVGRCTGGCEGIHFPGECIPSPDYCYLYGDPVQGRCVPQTTTQQYIHAGGVKMSVVTIISCQCARQ